MVLACPACSASNDETDEVCFECGQALSPTAGAVVGGRYEILRRLGRGGMGTVYRAHDRVLDEVVALKLLRGDLTAVPEMARRFRSEIKLARRVTHPNVCRIHDYGEDGRTQFISMEIIEGVDLKQLLRRQGSLDVDEAFRMSIQAVDGLQAIHAVGIVHRDLKTPNIMRDARDTIRLMDFGIAKEYMAGSAGPTITGHIVGTPEYMSPEQARGEKIDPRSDIYSIAIVVFELFTGEVPFRAETPIATLFKQIQEPPPLDKPLASKLPAPLVPVLRKALAKDPEDRHQTAQELSDELVRARAEWRSGIGAESTSRTEADGRIPAPPADTSRLTTPRPPPTVVQGEPALPVTPHVPTPTRPPSEKRPTIRVARDGGPTMRRGLRPVWPWIVGATALAAVAVAAVVLMLAPEQVAPAPEPTGPPAPSAAPATTEPNRSEPTMPPVIARSETPAPRLAPSFPATVSLRTSDAPLRSPRPAPSPSVEAARTPEPTPTPEERDGTLRIAVVPWAEVEVDGVGRGVSPPLKPLSLPAGEHVVRLLHPTYAPFRRRLTIRAGEATTLSVDLTKEAFPK